MIEYKGQLNMGNEALGTEKTITANESLRTCDMKALAREISHQNTLIPEDVAASVLGYFCGFRGYSGSFGSQKTAAGSRRPSGRK